MLSSLQVCHFKILLRLYQCDLADEYTIIVPTYEANIGSETKQLAPSGGQISNRRKSPKSAIPVTRVSNLVGEALSGRCLKVGESFPTSIYAGQHG